MIVYASDEDVAIRAPSDFALLCPKDQVLASGGDGAFAAGDRWTLTSATVNFAAAGLAPGQVVQITRTGGGLRATPDALVVQSVGNAGVVLRRKGQPAGAGQPPSPQGGMPGVEFLVATLQPQINRACDDLNRRLGLGSPGRRPEDLGDPAALREVAVLMVLHRQYLDRSREAEGQPDAFGAKARAIQSELDDRLGRLAVRFRDDPGGRPSQRFRTRLGR